MDAASPHVASREGNESIASLLLEEKGVDVDAKDVYHGKTPLHDATICGHEIIISLLLEKGANANAKETRYEQTPLHYASIYGNENIVSFLLLGKGCQRQCQTIGWKDATSRGLLCRTREYRFNIVGKGR
jgi:ankyrin repeat protein